MTTQDGQQPPSPDEAMIGHAHEPVREEPVTDPDAATPPPDAQAALDDADPEMTADPDVTADRGEEGDGPVPGDPGGDEPAGAELTAALAATQAERDEYLDALQRARAEFDNFRKRSAREAAAARGHGAGDLAMRLLEVLDDLDRTVEHAPKVEHDALVGGIAQIHRKLLDVLRGADIHRLDEVGVPFDPTVHEAVSRVEADEELPEPEVADVLRPGYRLGQRVLRPAMVAVRA